jgi:hypothetical protein
MTLQDRLREDLVAAAVARHRRRRVRIRGARIAAVVVGLATAAAVVLGAVTYAPERAEARVEVRGGWVVVTLVDGEHDPGTIEAALARAGVRARVLAVPVGPSLVGRFVGAARAAALPEGIAGLHGRPGATRCAYAGLSLAPDRSGGLEVRVGRPAAGDEPYATFSDAFAPGEPLAGKALRGRSLEEVDRLLRDRGVQVEAEVISGTTASVLPLATAARGDHRRWTVVGADATSRRRVLLRTEPPGHPPPAPRGC